MVIPALKLRKFVDRFFPKLGLVYRTFRNARNETAKFKTTPYGFKFSGNETMIRGRFEPRETEIIIQQLASADVFVDVGANIGFYTCLARSMGKYTIAFEPLIENLRCLYRNLRENSWNDVEVYPLGLSNKSGLKVLYGEGTGASLVEGWANHSPLLWRTIPVSTLDTILGQRFAGKRLIIKVDVEGGELDVLKGGLRTLQQSPRPFWLVENCLTEHHPAGMNPNFCDVFKTFWRYNYEARNILNNRISPIDLKKLISKPDISQLHNYIFLPK